MVEEEGQGGAADEVQVEEEGSVTQGVENVLIEERRASSPPSSPAARPASRASSAGGAPEDFKVRRKRIRH
jgi:hypothetical protein